MAATPKARPTSPALLTLHQGLKGDPRQNHLLASLPAAEWERWQPHFGAAYTEIARG